MNSLMSFITILFYYTYLLTSHLPLSPQNADVQSAKMRGYGNWTLSARCSSTGSNAKYKRIPQTSRVEVCRGALTLSFAEHSLRVQKQETELCLQEHSSQFQIQIHLSWVCFSLSLSLFRSPSLSFCWEHFHIQRFILFYKASHCNFYSTTLQGSVFQQRQEGIWKSLLPSKQGAWKV